MKSCASGVRLGLHCLLIPLTGMAAPRQPPLKPAVSRPTTTNVSKAPASRRLDVVLKLNTGVPAELAPFKPGSTTERLPAQLQAVAAAGPLSPITALAFSSDGKRLFVGTEGRVTIWDLAEGRVVGHLVGVEGVLEKVHDLAFSPDGKRLAVAGGQPGRSGLVMLYDGVAPAAPVSRLSGHTDVVYNVAWSPDGQRLATASFDKTARVWEAATLKEALVVREHTDFVRGVAFAKGSTVLVSGSQDRSVKLTDIASGKSIRALTGLEQPVGAVAVAPDGLTVVAGCEDAQLRWWNADTGAQIRTVGGHGGEIGETHFSADGKRLLTVSVDKTARLFDGSSGGEQRAFGTEDDPLLTVALSADGKRVAAGSISGLLRVWDAESGRLLVLGYEDPRRTPQSEWLLTTPDGYVATSAGLGGRLRWQVSGQPMPAVSVDSLLRKPDEVKKALRGEDIPGVSIPLPTPAAPVK